MMAKGWKRRHYGILVMALLSLVGAAAILERGPASLCDKDARSSSGTVPSLEREHAIRPQRTEAGLNSTPLPSLRNPVYVSFVDKSAPIELRVPSDISSRLPPVDDPVDLAAMISVLRDTTDKDVVRHEVVELLRRSRFQGLTDEILALLERKEEKERFRSYLVQHLGIQVGQTTNRSEKTKIVGKLLECLNDPQTGVRRESLLSLVRLQVEGIGGRVSALLRDGTSNATGMRDVAIRCARELGLREDIDVIRALVTDPQESVSVQAIVTISAWGDQKSRDLLVVAANSASMPVRRAAQAGLRKLGDPVPKK